VVQGIGKEVTYSLIREEGPEHDKTFIVEVSVDGLIKIEGSGHNKKNAQANAAYAALVELKSKGIEIIDRLK
jgi:ribonuclease-3